MGELYNPYPKLPKNIRQIGERDQSVRLYVEDYVNTYLKRLYPTGGQDLRVGLLLGEVRTQEGVPFLFVDGALEMEDVTRNGEQVDFTEAAWKQAYAIMEQQFPRRNILGWFLCGVPGSTLSPLNYWKQHGQYFSSRNQLMYLNSGLEGEEVIYTASDDGFYKLRGYSIYYERNQMMQDYMVSRKDARRVESGTRDVVIRDFRQKQEDRKVRVRKERSKTGTLGLACGAMSLVLLAGGVVSFNNYQKMKEMEAVIASVVPERYIGSTEDDVTPIEIVPGEVYPTLAAAQESAGDVQEAGAGSESFIWGDAVMPGESDLSGGNGQGGESGQTGQIGQSGDTNSGGESGLSQNGENSLAGEAGDPAQTQPAQPVQVPADAILHVVEEGETLYGICMERYASISPIEEICLWNSLGDENRISIGQELYLPPS